MSNEQRGHWYRSYEEMSKDPKFRSIAKRASSSVPGVRVSDAIAVWVNLLERASQATDRGSIDGFDGESVDDLFEMPEGASDAILKAFEDKGMLHDGRIAKWDERQPQRERPNDLSTERTRKFKANKKAELDQGTPGNATGTPGNAPDQNRSEQNTHKEEGRVCEREDGKPPKLDRPSKASRPQDWKGFMLLWSVYPIKQGQEDAWNEYCRLKDNATLEDPAIMRDQIMNMTSNDSRWQRGIGIKSLDKWLRGKCWNDEPFIEQPVTTHELPTPVEAMTEEQWRAQREATRLRGKPKPVKMAGAQA